MCYLNRSATQGSGVLGVRSSCFGTALKQVFSPSLFSPPLEPFGHATPRRQQCLSMLLQLSWSQGATGLSATCRSPDEPWSCTGDGEHWHGPLHQEQAEGMEQPSLCQERSSIGTGAVFPSLSEVPECCLYLDTGIF